MRDVPLEEARARMQAHFPNQDAGKGERWELLWKENEFLPFDRGIPNPALEDVLAGRQDVIGTPTTPDGRRKTALVPGCGRGYDVLLLASFGYDAYGLEVSETAVRRCFEEKEKNGHKYAVKNADVGAGKAEFVPGDFFKDEWFAQTGTKQFDLVYDYTFLCALPPAMRPAWALKMSQLVKAEGHLICLEFPSKKDPKLGGPPFGLAAPVYSRHLANPGDSVLYLENGHVNEDAEGAKSNIRLECIARWEPERTHAIGKGQDWVSIWAHPKD